MASNCDCIESILDAVDVVKSDASEITATLVSNKSTSDDAPDVANTVEDVKFDTNETTTAVAVDEPTSNNTPNTSDTISEVKVDEELYQLNMVFFRARVIRSKSKSHTSIQQYRKLTHV